eukprot:jgi/Botrbrau1/10006/Bobra.0012s0094.1
MAAALAAIPADLQCLSIEDKDGQEKSKGEKWWEQEPGTSGKHRTVLPPAPGDLPPVNIWSILRNAGLSLVLMPLPIQVYEPMTHLMKMAEDLEYTELLDKAAAAPRGSMERLLLIGAQTATWYAAAHRTSRPFNCTWGETFELVLPHKRVRALYETVHFNILEDRFMHAGIIEGERWLLEFEDEPAVKLTTSGLDIRNERWINRLTFHDGDVYQWNKLISTLNIGLTGKMHFVHHGTIQVDCKTAPLSLILDAPKKKLLSGFSRSASDFKPGQVVGKIVQEGREVAYPQLVGNFHTGVDALHQDGSRLPLWRPHPQPAGARYEMTCFAASLGEMTPELQDCLPPTDSRRRPDLRALDVGDYALAVKEKDRLERVNIAGIKAINRTPAKCHKPRWFRLLSPDVLSEPYTVRKWKYAGGYWEARASGNWSGISSDYFGLGFMGTSSAPEE